MSILKSNGSDLLSSRSEIISNIPNLNRMDLNTPHHDMLNRELKIYDWVLVITTSREKVIKRIGVVVKFTKKKVTIMARGGWWVRDKVEKTSVYADKLLKIDQDIFKHLINCNS